MARPKGTTKYITKQQREAAKRANTTPQIRSRYFRLVIPDLTQYKGYLDQLTKLKGDTLNLLLEKQTPSGLQYYKLAVETHPTTGVPHLDILLLYSKSVMKSLNRFDYLIKHGHLTRYKNLNAAILAYSDKEDKLVLTNLPKTPDPVTGELKQDTSRVLNVAQLKKDPYRYLELQMLKDPLHFNLEQYCRTHDLFKYISGWSGIKTKLKDSQLAAANIQLRSKSGFRYIDKPLIEANLNPSQLNAYLSWSGYQTIVDYLNHILEYSYERPFKSKQLFLTGSPNIGKSSLVLKLQQSIPVYHMDVSNWFPSYRSNVYRLIFWDQFKLKGGMSHTDLLKFLQGSPMDLQYKGGSTLKNDNPLIIMTSNMTLDEHIEFKFKDTCQRKLAKQNLDARIQNLVVPTGLDLHFIRKLIKPKNGSLS